MHKWVNPVFTLVLVVRVEAYPLWVVLEPAEILCYILGTLPPQGISHCLQNTPVSKETTFQFQVVVPQS